MAMVATLLLKDHLKKGKLLYIKWSILSKVFCIIFCKNLFAFTKRSEKDEKKEDERQKEDLRKLSNDKIERLMKKLDIVNIYLN